MADEVREVRREAEFEASPAELWEALTDERLLSEWLGADVEIEPEEGGALRVREGDDEREGTVTRVEDERSIAFTWERNGSGLSEVEFVVDAVVGGSRLIVVERALVGPTSMSATTWSLRLAALATALTLVTA
jgi:uncharacterized protein YndB with AHSA1/START domain